ncbi:MAG: GNAT family N-acetyltransferase [Desulfarculaceae bacterium]|nr:GNAT family N-acetyltransferase [Desulfarculaceae bacterium]MCF8073687.1 GNAT family N-acetyltransferase [Desulfarculaceae bacterium]MCF8101928.1 GNAT family N-acetyltransferase [Desulfarculaceae bacterium]MCF8117649.1 GNAT family N-acetyltransferase [Desulfarculaceae bacterium]
MTWTGHYRSRLMSAEQALAELRSGSGVLIGSGCGEPCHLVSELARLALRFRDIQIIQAISVSVEEYSEEAFAGAFTAKRFFVAAGARQAVSQGAADYVPLYLSDLPDLIASGRLGVDAVLIQVSPPDEHGWCSLGVAVDVVREAVEQARLVIAQVNPAMPRTLGDSFVPVSRLDCIVEHEEPLLSFSQPAPDEVALKAARQVARLIPDGATIHVGLGTMAQAVLAELSGRKNLGVHTDALTDGYLPLIDSGVITGAAKSLYPHKVVASFCLGGEKLARFVDNNPQVMMLSTRETNDPAVIAANHRMISVHEVLEVDLTGQVCSADRGGKVYAGVGGLVDFLRGASASPGGLGVVMLPSLGTGGASRIVPRLSAGAGVAMTRAGVRSVATEYGAAYLHGLSLRERAVALIDIAHPNHRDALLTAAREEGLISERQILAPLFTGVYPERYEQAAELKDGSHVLIRPVKPTDERMVQEFFYSMSDREVYYRFLHATKVFPKKDMQKMVNIDYHREMSLVALTGEFGSERMVGVARYVLGDEGTPEVDFAVATEAQGKGLGRALMGAVLVVAKHRGYEVVTAYVMPENAASLNILKTLGYAVTGLVSQGVIELKLHLDQPVAEPQVELKYDERFSAVVSGKPLGEDEPLSRI